MDAELLDEESSQISSNAPVAEIINSSSQDNPIELNLTSLPIVEPEPEDIFSASSDTTALRDRFHASFRQKSIALLFPCVVLAIMLILLGTAFIALTLVGESFRNANDHVDSGNEPSSPSESPSSFPSLSPIILSPSKTPTQSPTSEFDLVFEEYCKEVSSQDQRRVCTEEGSFVPCRNGSPLYSNFITCSFPNDGDCLCLGAIFDFSTISLTQVCSGEITCDDFESIFGLNSTS
eukprot:snap_masked-scaffold_10-processed-gene-11.35-mRNA-1 protein AED:1.00 eAED:1.00 QI:0/-1/0/0/-1/1/1/0/234